MSEFKYACPVCGQHIQCDSAQAGAAMDCPTCFQKITVPQAPGTAAHKFILTGTSVRKRRIPPPAAGGAAHPPVTAPATGHAAALSFGLAVLLAAAAGIYFFGGSWWWAARKWQMADVGSVGQAGSVRLEARRTLAVSGCGSDIWWRADAFCFAYQPLRGDAILTVRVTGMLDTDPWAKAGLMIRESLAPEAPNVLLCVTPHQGVALQQRLASGQPATSVFGLPQGQAPYWLRLQRRGDQFTAEASVDGRTWLSAGAATVSMPAQVYAGLAVCSHNAKALCTAWMEQPTLQ